MNKESTEPSDFPCKNPACECMQCFQMALYMKQDFTPPILSRKWIAIKFRPNMLLYAREHIITILESGLLFREDSISIEQEAPSPAEVWAAAGGSKSGWLTRGETVVCLAGGVAACWVIRRRGCSIYYAGASLAVLASLLGVHRRSCSGLVSRLTSLMHQYLTLARRAAACLKEYRALCTQIGSISSTIDSLHTMLRRQQAELCILMSRASSALLGNAPWLRDDVAWDAVQQDDGATLTQIHHAFLVVQSTLLKHIAMAHYIPSPQTQKLYKNHNERIYWLHHVLIKNLIEQFQSNLESLQRMYRLLKNAGNRENDKKKLGPAIDNNWLYSDVHTGVARTCLELKVALNKTNTLDAFLDSCATLNEALDLKVLNQDIDGIIDDITKCLTTIQGSQLKLKKLKGLANGEPDLCHEKDLIESAPILTIDDKEPETRDEVFYFVKTEDDDATGQHSADLTTAPGKKEKETSKIVLSELKRKLGKREDVMRERERQALSKTMPELKNVPEFPRQIKFDEFIDRKGYISKLRRKRKEKLFRDYKIKNAHDKPKKYSLKVNYYEKESEKNDFLEANAFLNAKSRYLTLISENAKYVIVRWCKKIQLAKQVDNNLSDSSEVGTVNRKVNNRERFSKRDLEISGSTSESDSDYYENQRQLLKDIRRHRVARRKNYPNNKEHRQPAIDNVDESLKPIEYSLGTGLAMASVLQVNKAKFLNMAQEEVFLGDGEVSNDSGNDEDA